MQRKDQELDNKSKLLEKYATHNNELKKENKQISLKLRQIQTTQMKDLNKKLRERESETEVLKEMVKSA